jgi:hypothetical protein
VTIEVRDADQNLSMIRFTVQYDASLAKAYTQAAGERLIPGNLNVFEREEFELFTTEHTIYDTVGASFSASDNGAAGSASPLYTFLGASIPSHDSVTVRIRPSRELNVANHVIIKNISGSRTFIQRADWQKGWVAAKFRQFGTYQAFVDDEPPVVNAPATNLTKASRIVFTPKDNFNVIRSLRAEVDGQWLRFTNDKGRSWIYTFDEKFPGGTHELKVEVEDEAGNVTTKIWTVTR